MGGVWGKRATVWRYPTVFFGFGEGGEEVAHLEVSELLVGEGLDGRGVDGPRHVQQCEGDGVLRHHRLACHTQTHRHTWSCRNNLYRYLCMNSCVCLTHLRRCVRRRRRTPLVRVVPRPASGSRRARTGTPWPCVAPAPIITNQMNISGGWSAWRRRCEGREVSRAFLRGSLVKGCAGPKRLKFTLKSDTSSRLVTTHSSRLASTCPLGRWYLDAFLLGPIPTPPVHTIVSTQSAKRRLELVNTS